MKTEISYAHSIKVNLVAVIAIVSLSLCSVLYKYVYSYKIFYYIIYYLYYYVMLIVYDSKVCHIQISYH